MKIIVLAFATLVSVETLSPGALAAQTTTCGKEMWITRYCGLLKSFDLSTREILAGKMSILHQMISLPILLHDALHQMHVRLIWYLEMMGYNMIDSLDMQQ